MLDRLKNPTLAATRLENVAYQDHHIIPKHCGGSDDSWNLTKLTMEEHTSAHRLRWETYSDPNDSLALKGMQAQYNTEEMIAARVKLSHEVQKREKRGRWDSTAQRERGLKGGAKQTAAKKEKYKDKLSDTVKEFLSKKSVWQHEKNTQQTVFEPNQFSLVVELLEQLIVNTQDNESRDKLQNTAKTTATGALARVIKGDRKTCYGWKIVPPS